MSISKNDLNVLITFNILRCFLSYFIIFKTDINIIVKCYILFFSGGLDSLDSTYPKKLGLYKEDTVFNLNKGFGDYYRIPDKINDILSNWSFFVYLNREKILDNFEINLLRTVLINRSIGLFLYFLKNAHFLRKFKISSHMFFYFPDYFSIFSMYFLILKKYDKKRKTGVFVLLILFKLTQEYYLHVK